MSTPPSPVPSPRIAALLLAAGLSQRMGVINKLLADVGGETMVRRAARLMLGCGLDLYVVTGHEREKIEEALEGLPLVFIHNANYHSGQRSSVRAGLAVINGTCDGALVALGDQPALQHGDIEALLDAFAETDGSRFLVPYYGGKRGNPVIVPAVLISELLDRGGGAGPLTDLFPDRVARFEAANDHYLRDIDTQEALAHFKRNES